MDLKGLLLGFRTNIGGTGKTEDLQMFPIFTVYIEPRLQAMLRYPGKLWRKESALLTPSLWPKPITKLPARQVIETYVIRARKVWNEAVLTELLSLIVMLLLFTPKPSLGNVPQSYNYTE